MARRSSARYDSVVSYCDIVTNPPGSLTTRLLVLCNNTNAECPSSDRDAVSVPARRGRLSPPVRACTTGRGQERQPRAPPCGLYATRRGSSQGCSLRERRGQGQGRLCRQQRTEVCASGRKARRLGPHPHAPPFRFQLHERSLIKAYSPLFRGS